LSKTLRGTNVTDLLSHLVAAIDRREACVWCVVVATRGSTPQKAGAAMLVYADGSQAGTLGGGCVEADVKQKVVHRLASGGGPEAFTFVLDDDFGWDDGLICGGRMTVLAHPLTPDRPDFAGTADYYRRLFALADAGNGWTEAVAVERAVGVRYLFDAEGNLVTCLNGTGQTPVPPDVIAANLQPLATRPKTAVHAGIAYLPTFPRVTLFLVGGGHVARAVADLAAKVGFQVWVLDDREKFVGADRFPDAEKRLVGDIGDTLITLAPTLGPHHYALVLTRGHSHDEEALYHLATTRCGFVGMIGSKRKVRLILDDLDEKGVPRAALDRVRAPLGFNIGSQTVPEIAVSLVAELIAVRNLGRAAAGLPP
jgi:xanthine dehydrogenase accessory factor